MSLLDNMNLSRSINTLLLVLVLAGCQKQLTPEEYLSAAEVHFSNEEHVAASIELKNALKLDPNNGKSRNLLGKVNLLLGLPEAAEKEFRKARELNPDNSSTAKYFIESLVQQGKVKESLEVSLDNVEGPDLAHALITQSLGLLTILDYEAARPKLAEALVLQPTSTFGLSVMARLEFETGNIVKARQLLSQIFELDPVYPPAKEILGDIEWSVSNLPDATNAFISALAGSKSASILLKITQVLVLQGEYEKANEYLQLLKKTKSKKQSVEFIEGLILFQKEQYVDAQLNFEKALALDPSFMPAVFYLSQTHLQIGNIEQSLQHAQRFYNMDSTSVDARKLLARVRISMGDTDEASNILQTLVDNGVKDKEITGLLAAVLFKTGQLDEAVGLLESNNSLYGVGRSVPKETSESDSVVENEISGDDQVSSSQNQLSTAQADVIQILRHLDNNKIDQALSDSIKMQQAYPESITPIVLAARAHLAANNTELARSALETAMVKSPGNSSAGLLLGGIAYVNGEYAKARSVYEEVLERSPENLQALLNLARIKSLDADIDGMVETLETAITLNPDAQQPRMILSRYLLSENEPDKALSLINKFNIGRNSSSELLILATDINNILNNHAVSKGYLSILSERQPENTEVLYKYAEALRNTGDQERALIELGRVAQLDPAYVQAHILTARISAEMGNRVQYVRSRERLSSLANSNSELRDALDDMPTAEQLFGTQPVTDQNGLDIENIQLSSLNSSHDVQRASRALWKNGDKRESISLLEKWSVKNPQDLPVLLTLASAYIQLGDEGKGISEYKKVLSTDKNNAVALNNLAWYLQDVEPVEALGFAGRARILAPHSASTLDTLAIVQLKNGLIEKSLESIEAALSLEPGNRSFLYHKALIHTESGEDDIALGILDKLLKDRSLFTERDSAEELANKIRSKRAE